jgi:conjugal transfer pilus assembly protein TraV
MVEGSEIVTRQLLSHEMASLNRALVKRTKGRVSVGPASISVAEGIALWNATAVFASVASALPPLVRRRSRGGVSGDTVVGLRRTVSTGALLAVTASLGACATFGGNVKGDFACRAPDGVCAPTSTIDDAALALIVGDTPVIKTGPYTPETTRPRVVQTAAAEPVRSGEKVLRIVFPAHIDEEGRYRESTAIHAVVERGAWISAANAPSESAQTSDASFQETKLAYDDTSDYASRSLGELASAAPEVHFPDPVADIDAQNAIAAKTAMVKTPVVTANVKPVRLTHGIAQTGAAPAVAATRVVAKVSPAPANLLPAAVPTKGAANTSTIDPMAAIKAQVAQRLASSVPANPAGETVKPTPAKGPSLFPASGVNR